MLFHELTETLTIEREVKRKKMTMNKKTKAWLNLKIIINKRKKITLFFGTQFWGRKGSGNVLGKDIIMFFFTKIQKLLYMHMSGTNYNSSLHIIVIGS